MPDIPLPWEWDVNWSWVFRVAIAALRLADTLI
jgi:hypothetical protein